jgi:hypothetical protein
MAKKTFDATTKNPDPIHPDHYDGRACLDAIRAQSSPQEYVGFLKGQVLRYNWRLGRKDQAVIEAGKARFYQTELEEFLLDYPDYGRG